VVDELKHVPLELEIPTAPDERLLVRIWDAPTGRRLVSVAPQSQYRGEWRLRHPGLLLMPGVAVALASALMALAATIDAPEPQDPAPAPESRCASRWP
jgi:hypothetical protein